MKKIISAVLTAVLFCSMFVIVSDAATMGKTQSKLVAELTEFIKTAQTQVTRDDWQNVPGETGEHPLTTILKTKIEESKALRAERNIDKMDAFLVELYGGWVEIKDKHGYGTGEYGYGDINKPYTEYLNTLNLSWGGGNYQKGNHTGLEYTIYYGEKPFSQLKSEDYTIESWKLVSNAVDNIKEYMNITAEYPCTHLAVCTRSEMFNNIQKYYEAYDKLFAFTGDKEVNKYRGLLYDVLYRKYDYTFEEQYSVMDVTKTEDCPAFIAFRDFVDKCRQVYEDTSATLEQIKACLDIDPWYTVKNNDSTYIIKKTEAEARIADGALNESDIVMKTDESGNPTGEHLTTYVYENKMNEYIQNFRDSLFLGKWYISQKDSIYNKSVIEYNNGKFTEDNWNTFLMAYKQINASVSNYLTDESAYIAAVENMKEAYNQMVLPPDVTKKQYYIAYMDIKEWVKKSDMSVYTDASLNVFNTSISVFEENYALYQNGSQNITEDDLYTFVIYIYNAKDQLEQKTTQIPEIDFESFVNKMQIYIDEENYIYDEFNSWVEVKEFNDIQKECFEVYKQEYNKLKNIIETALQEIYAHKANPGVAITVTQDDIQSAMIEEASAKTSLILAIMDMGMDKIPNKLFKIGDADGSGSVLLADAMKTFQHVAGKTVLKGGSFVAADIDGDNNVALNDAMKIFQFVAGKVDNL